MIYSAVGGESCQEQDWQDRELKNLQTQTLQEVEMNQMQNLISCSNQYS